MPSARLIRCAAVPLLAVLTLVGCGASTPTGASPSVSDAPATASGVVPEPGRTLPAAPPDTDRLDGYAISIVVPSADADSAVAEGVRSAAVDRGATVEIVEATSSALDDVGTAFEDAVAGAPDLVVGIGDGVVDLFSFETAQRLDQQFLVVGAQLAEPTANVTSVIWAGATSRGSAASADGALDAVGATNDRGAAALLAGVASIRAGITGVVLDLDAAR